MSEDVEYRSVPLPLGEVTEVIGGHRLPQITRDAAAKAGGVLERTVYVAMESSESKLLMAAALGYHRPHTAQQKLTALGGDERLYAGLLAFANRSALQNGAIVVKRDFDVDPEMHWKTRSHYRQTTEFTCGPVAVMDAFHHLGLLPAPNRDEELQLWREATMGVACDPYGLALAAGRRGLRPEIWVSACGTVLSPESGLGVLDASMARDVQNMFERQARKEEYAVRVAPFDAQDVAGLIDSGCTVVLLIDEAPMHGVTCPHWITVVGHVKGALIVDDPWTDTDFGETAVDAYHMPIPLMDLDCMIHYGAPQSAQAMLVFRSDSTTA